MIKWLSFCPNLTIVASKSLSLSVGIYFTSNQFDKSYLRLSKWSNTGLKYYLWPFCPFPCYRFHWFDLHLRWQPSDWPSRPMSIKPRASWGKGPKRAWDYGCTDGAIFKGKEYWAAFRHLTTISIRSWKRWACHFLFENDELIFWSENLDISSIPEESTKLVLPRTHGVYHTGCRAKE